MNCMNCGIECNDLMCKTCKDVEDVEKLVKVKPLRVKLRRFLKEKKAKAFFDYKDDKVYVKVWTCSYREEDQARDDLSIEAILEGLREMGLWPYYCATKDSRYPGWRVEVPRYGK